MLKIDRAPRKSRQESRYWDDSGRSPLAMGCTVCLDRAICGGIHAQSGAFNCLSYCCGNPQKCDIVCPRAPERFVARVREVGGLDLGNLPRGNAISFERFPATVPYVYNRGRRRTRFSPPAVALSLYSVVGRQDGTPRFGTREAMCAHFGIATDCRILLSGTARDKPLERWWGLGPRRLQAIRALKALGITAITTPNFSVFSDRPRWDDLHSMKRIAIVWQEMSSEGLATALHVNARTWRDWSRWTEFIRAREDVTGIAYEFATGAVGTARMGFHVEALCGVAESIGRPLTLIIRGGTGAIERLSSVFSTVILLDTTSFMKTVNRKRAAENTNGRLDWNSDIASVSTDELLDHNYLSFANYVNRISGSSASH